MPSEIFTPVTRSRARRLAAAAPGLTGQALSLATAYQAPVIPPGHPLHGMKPPPTAEEVAAVDQAVAEADGGDLYEGDGGGPALYEGDPLLSPAGESTNLYGDDLGPVDYGPWLDQIISDAEAEMAANPKLRKSTRLAAADDEDRQVTIGLATALADQGDYVTAATALRNLGEPYLELSGGDFYDVGRIMDLAVATERQRQAEDGQPLPRNAEDRAAALVDRVARGTYAPTPGMMSLAPASSAAAALARHRWQAREVDVMAGTVPGDPCGVVDDMGRCGERYHEAHCNSIASPDIATGLASGGAYDRLSGQPWLDQNHRLWTDQATGSAMSLSDHVLAASGTARTPAPFTGQRRGEVPQAARQARYGDPDDPGDRGEDMPSARALADRAGLPRQPTAVRERQRFAALRAAALADIGLRAHGRVHMDQGESIRERAARMHRPVVLQEAEADPGTGGLMRYTAG
jgi:hypothetical protein